MKGIIPIIILILIVLGIVFFTNNKKIEAPTNEDLVENTEEVSSESEGEYSVNVEKSSATWTGSKTIIKEYVDTGSIEVKNGNLNINEGMVLNGEIVFDMTTIMGEKTGSGGGEDKLTTHLKTTDFFDVEKYPEATYQVSEVTETEEGFNLKGSLTIKDIANPLDIPVTIAMTEDGSVIVKGVAEVDRTMYDIKFGSGKFFDNLGDNVISDIFTLDFEIVANK